MTALTEKIIDPDYVPILFALTPPKAEISPEKLSRMNNRRKERLFPVNLDGLCIYDVQDESARTNIERPYESHRYLAPVEYRESIGQLLELECITFCAVGRFSSYELCQWVSTVSPEPAVFVGAPVSDIPVKISLNESYKLQEKAGASPLLGAVCIPGRQGAILSEAERMIWKIDQGVGFFVTQCLYDDGRVETMITKYASLCSDIGIKPAKIIFTFSPAGSRKAIEFFQWLGIYIPDEIIWRILKSNDPLSESVVILYELADRIANLCMQLDIPFGFNIESIISRKDDFMAAVELSKALKEKFPVSQKTLYA